MSNTGTLLATIGTILSQLPATIQKRPSAFTVIIVEPFVAHCSTSSARLIKFVLDCNLQIVAINEHHLLYITYSVL